MKVILCRDYQQNENKIHVQQKKKTAVALGNFDGVHLGHARLIDEIVKKKDMYSCVYTFEKHPGKAINKSFSIKIITDNTQKVDILTQMGIDYVCFEQFENVKDLPPADFVKKVLIDELNCGCAVCGCNFKFGKNAAGDANFLKTELAKYGAECIIEPPVMYEDAIISSTRIRFLIESGAVDAASKLLGRPFSIRSLVIEGKKLGRTIGIPTINQKFNIDGITPKYGVYICRCIIDGKEYSAICDVGTKPTVGGTELLAETHIIDYSGFLYGKIIEVQFLKKIRDEEKFPNTEVLKEAINNDIKQAKKYFSCL